MTTTLQRFVGPACLLLVATSCGGNDEEVQAGPPEPLVIESPRTRVVVGADTMLVFGPTMFAYLGLDNDEARPSLGLLEAAQQFQTGVQAALEQLRMLGVRVEAVSVVPELPDVPPDADAGAGPTLVGAPYGYLFVDPAGHLRRVTSRMETAQMLCVAAGTFGLTLSAEQSAACR